jgi:uncharacterized protein (DUF58 family)
MATPEKKPPRIYIFPTRFGIGFIGGAVVMILIGASYQNNLVNLLAFFMLSVTFISMIQTHNNLKDVRLTLAESEGGFAGTEFVVTAVLANRASSPRFNLNARLRRKKPRSVYDQLLPLQAESTLKVRSSYDAGKRGKYVTKGLSVSTTYPLGLFRAWMVFDTKLDYFVYPVPKGHRPMPFTAAEEGTVQLHEIGGEDFHGHRKYQQGDSHRHVDWKAKARGRPLLVKQFNEGAPQALHFDWNALKGMPVEERLSQMAGWVEEARKRKLVYGLALPQRKIAPGHGHQHAVLCLQALAEFTEQSDSTNEGARR